jgi:hypothetical protein
MDRIIDRITGKTAGPIGFPIDSIVQILIDVMYEHAAGGGEPIARENRDAPATSLFLDPGIALHDFEAHRRGANAWLHPDYTYVELSRIDLKERLETTMENRPFRQTRSSKHGISGNDGSFLIVPRKSGLWMTASKHITEPGYTKIRALFGIRGEHEYTAFLESVVGTNLRPGARGEGGTAGGRTQCLICYSLLSSFFSRQEVIGVALTQSEPRGSFGRLKLIRVKWNEEVQALAFRESGGFEKVSDMRSDDIMRLLHEAGEKLRGARVPALCEVFYGNAYFRYEACGIRLVMEGYAPGGKRKRSHIEQEYPR